MEAPFENQNTWFSCFDHGDMVCLVFEVLENNPNVSSVQLGIGVKLYIKI